MIFIVDDDSAARDSLRCLLECEGIEVEDFASAEAFLAALPQAEKGCLIADVKMPGMSGLDLLEKLRGDGSQLTAIVVSGLPSAATKQRAERAGATFLDKPFNDPGLAQLLRQTRTSA